MSQVSFDQRLVKQMEENKPIDFLYPNSKDFVLEGKLKFISLKTESANIEFLNSGEPEVINVPLDNIYIPADRRIKGEYNEGHTQLG